MSKLEKLNSSGSLLQENEVTQMGKANMVKASDLLEYMKGQPNLKWFVAMSTDQFICDDISELHKLNISNLLELRGFNEDYEIKAVRGTIGKDFQVRDTRVYEVRTDEQRNEISSDVSSIGGFQLKEEVQYLDIDTTVKLEGKLRATGGGEYSLPVEGKDRVVVVNYYKEDEIGMYQHVDFRIQMFIQGEKQDEK